MSFKKNLLPSILPSHIVRSFTSVIVGIAMVMFLGHLRSFYSLIHYFDISLLFNLFFTAIYLIITLHKFKGYNMLI